MATQAEVQAYSRAINDLSTVAYAQLKALLQSLDTPNPIEFRDALLSSYPELMRPFFAAASDVAAVWYTELRRESSIRVAHTPFVVGQPPSEQLGAGVRYSLTPMFAPESEFIGSDILRLLAGFTQRMIADQGRDTIIGNADADRVRVGYQRVPMAGCCAFCALMASRGAVYNSASSAGQVQGRGVDASATAGRRGGQGLGVKARGSQAIGNKFHNFCRCVVVPRFVGGDNSYLQDTQAFYMQQYQDLEARDGSIRAPGEALTLKDVLADWRHTHGTK